VNRCIFLRASFQHSEKQVIQQARLSPVSEPGPKARRVACHIAGERALSRAAQMVQQPTVSKFFDIMEKVLLEQG